MKLILTADVPNLGAPGDIVEVKDGYGRNYLLPRSLAVVATRGAEKQVASIRRSQTAAESERSGLSASVAIGASRGSIIPDFEPFMRRQSGRASRRTCA